MITTSTQRIKFNKDDIDKLKKYYKTKSNKKALENWAYYEYDLMHNASIYIKRIGKTFIDIAEMS